jgi:hypothetical protein
MESTSSRSVDDNYVVRRLVIVSFGFNLIALLLMLNHQSDSGTVLGRYSASYAAMLFVMLGLVAFSAWCVLRRCRWLGELAARHLAGRMWIAIVATLVGPIALGLFWVFMPGATHLFPIALFRVVISMHIIVGVIATILATGETASFRSRRLGWVLAGLVSGVGIFMTLMYVGRIPPTLYYDEPYLTNLASAWAETGLPVIPMIPQRPSEVLALQFGGGYYALGVWLQAVGLSLHSTRFFWILIAWLAAPFVFLAVRRMFGQVSALFATSVLFLLPLAHNYVRADILASTLIAAGILALLVGHRRQSGLWYAVSGLLFGLTIESHQLALRFGMVVLAILGVVYINRMWKRGHLFFDKPFWSFLGGLLIAGAVYGLLHIFVWGNGDFTGILNTFISSYTLEEGRAGNLEFPHRFVASVRDWFDWLARAFPLDFVAILFGTVTVTFFRGKPTQLVLMLFWASAIFLFIVNPKPATPYLSHHISLTAMMAAIPIAWLAQYRVPEPDPARVNLPVVAAFLMAGTLFAAFAVDQGAHTQSADDLIAIGYDIDSVLPLEVETVIGYEPYYYGLHERDFRHVNTFVHESVPDAAQRWDFALPQAVILTAGLGEHDFVLTYIDNQRMVPVRCYETGFFGGQTTLYVLPEFADAIPDHDCHTN